MFCPRHPRTMAARICGRCRLPMCAACVRWAGGGAYCGEICATLALMDRASAAGWALAAAESRRSVHGLLDRLRLLPLRHDAARAQRRLDLYLATRRAGRLEPPPQPWWQQARVAAPAAALLVIVAATALAFVPRRRAPAPPPEEPVVAMAPSAPVPIAPAPIPAPAVERPPAPAPAPAPPAVTRPAPVPRAPRASGPLPPAGPAPDISRGSLDANDVALTFDADSEFSGAEAVLDALRSRGIHVTIFLTAGYIRKYPELVRRIVADGHEVGNHTRNHPHLTTYERDGRQATLPHVTREFLHAQLRAAEDAYREATGRSMSPIWRAPFGEHNTQIRAWAEDAGYRHVGWTRDAASREDLDTRDWVTDRSSKIYRSAAEIRDRILRFGEGNGHGLNGGIILMHLGTQRARDAAYTRLPEILDGLAARGYRIVTASAFLRDLPPLPALARAAAR